MAHTLHLVRRALLPQTSAWWLPLLAALLALATSLPWFVSQLMPDLFTPLLVLVLALLCLAPECLSYRERCWLVLLAAFMIAVHQSNLPLALGLLLVLLPLRRWLAPRHPSVEPVGCAPWRQWQWRCLPWYPSTWLRSAAPRCRRMAMSSCWRASSTTVPA